MKKIILSIATVLIFATNANAQFLAKDSVKTQTGITVAGDQDFGLYVNFTSPSADTNYTWSREIVFLTPGWSTAVCDPFLCHSDMTTTAKFFVPEGETAVFTNHFYTDDQTGGRGVVRLIIENDVTKVRDTTIFELQLWNQLLSVSELDGSENQDVKIYPNPASSILKIQNKDVKSVTLTSTDGKVLKNIDVISNLDDITINTEDLPTGLYLVKIRKTNGVGSTQKVSIQN